MKPAGALALASHFPAAVCTEDAFCATDAGCLAAISAAKQWDLVIPLASPLAGAPLSFHVDLKAFPGSLQFVPLYVTCYQHDGWW